MIGVLLTIAQTETPRAVQLVTAEPAVEAVRSDKWLWMVCVAAVGLAAMSIWMVRTARALAPSDPRELALRRLARRFGLRRAHVQMLRRMAAAQGAPTLGVLVCEGAFRDAAAAVERRVRTKGERAVLADLRLRLAT